MSRWIDVPILFLSPKLFLYWLGGGGRHGSRRSDWQEGIDYARAILEAHGFPAGRLPPCDSYKELAMSAPVAKERNPLFDQGF